MFTFVCAISCHRENSFRLIFRFYAWCVSRSKRCRLVWWRNMFCNTFLSVSLPLLRIKISIAHAHFHTRHGEVALITLQAHANSHKLSQMQWSLWNFVYVHVNRNTRLPHAAQIIYDTRTPTPWIARNVKRPPTTCTAVASKWIQRTASQCCGKSRWTEFQFRIVPLLLCVVYRCIFFCSCCVSFRFIKSNRTCPSHHRSHQFFNVQCLNSKLSRILKEKEEIRIVSRFNVFVSTEEWRKKGNIYMLDVVFLLLIEQ